MSFKSQLKLDSPIFSRAARRAAVSRAIVRTAQKWGKDLGQKQLDSPHTGVVETVSRGGFRQRHQRSRRGERPSPLSKRLMNSQRLRRVSETQVEVEITAPYAERLQKDLDRVIVSDGDLKEGTDLLNQNIATEFSKLV